MGAHNREGLPSKEGVGDFHKLAGEAGSGVEIMFGIDPPEGSILYDRIRGGKGSYELHQGEDGA